MEIYEVRVHDDGIKEWYKNGKRHRLDGPAIEWADACNGEIKEWYIDGKKLTEEEFLQAVNSDCV